MRKLSLLLLLLTTVAAYGDVTGPVAPPGGSGGGGSVNFSQILSGTNVNALVIGTGGSLSSSGGIIEATIADGATTTPTVCPSGEASRGVDSSFNAADCFTPAGSGTVNAGTLGQVTYYSASGSAVSGSSVLAVGASSLAAAVPVGLEGYATASLPTCNGTTNKGAVAYTTDGTPALTFCNGTNWTNAGGTQFTYVATGCTPSASAGSATAGSITLAAGPCTSIVITPNGAVGMTAANGWDCDVSDQTTQAAGTWIQRWGQSASTTTTATIPIPSAAGATDKITFHCVPY